VSRRPGGAGIGLRHARKVSQEHGGALALVEPGPLPGACFDLLWPAGEPIGESEAPPSSHPAPRDGLRGARVLLLEDDAAVIELLELSLGARGAAVTSVTSAPALGDALDGGGYDVLLVDLSPLGETLDATVARARRSNPDIRVVVISGSVAAEPRPGMVWVRKPFEPRELVDAIVRERARRR
jgi:CheY-like chemotaxis protein